MRLYDIKQHCGLPYIVTEIKETENPELYYKERYTIKCFINNDIIECANIEGPKNPLFQEELWNN